MGFNVSLADFGAAELLNFKADAGKTSQRRDQVQGLTEQCSITEPESRNIVLCPFSDLIDAVASLFMPTSHDQHIITTQDPCGTEGIRVGSSRAESLSLNKSPRESSISRVLYEVTAIWRL